MKGSSEFFGLNSYSTVLATAEKNDYELNGYVVSTQTYPNGDPIGNAGQTGSWLKDVPWGFRKLLQYIDARYLKPTTATGRELPLYVTEQGFCVKGEHNLPIEKAIHDKERIDYYRGYLKEVVEAINNDGVDIRGYFAWSLADNLEWLEGYIPRFGVTAVDRENGFKRHPKDSSKFLKEFFETAVKK